MNQEHFNCKSASTSESQLARELQRVKRSRIHAAGVKSLSLTRIAHLLRSKPRIARFPR